MSADLIAQWPPEISHLTISCPYCSADNQVSIRLCREEDLPGLIDECRTCKEWFIVEIGSEGIEVFKSITANLSTVKRMNNGK